MYADATGQQAKRAGNLGSSACGPTVGDCLAFGQTIRAVVPFGESHRLLESLCPTQPPSRAAPLARFGARRVDVDHVDATPELAKKPAAKTAKAATKAAPVKAYQRSWMTAEDLRLGDFRAPPPPYAFPMLSDDKAKEVYVDSAGRLYKERKYSGVVPNWRTRKRMRRGRCRVQDQKLTWIGFQNAFNSSRVFIQVDGQACGYVYRPDAKHIVIDLPAVSIDNSNFKRDILTGAFPSAVAMVHVSSIEDKGTRVRLRSKSLAAIFRRTRALPVCRRRPLNLATNNSHEVDPQ